MTATSTYVQLDEKSHSHHQRDHSDIDRHIFFLSRASDATYNNVPAPSDYDLKSESNSRRQQIQEPKQNALVLRAAREQYTLVTDHAIPPILHKGEILIKVVAIGLNPIDWKGP